MVELGTLSITTPASREMAGVLRSVVMSVAASAELTVDRVEDSALAVNEAFRSVLTHVAPETPLACVIESEEGSVRVSVRSTGSDSFIELDSLGSMILSGVTDELRVAKGPASIDFTVSNRS